MRMNWPLIVTVIAVMFLTLAVSLFVTTTWPTHYTRIENGCIVEYEAKGFDEPIVVERVCP